jgi:competence protein ComEC
MISIPARKDMALPVRAASASNDPRLFALAFTAGVLLVHVLPALPSLGVCALLASPALVPRCLRLGWGGFALGVLLSVWHGQQWQAQRWPESRQGEEHVVQGRIASLPTRDGDALHFLFEPTADPDNAGLPSRMRAGWYRTDAAPRGGECWTLRLRLRAPRGSSNPDGFDYEAWLYRQDINAVATVREGAPCAAGTGEGFSLLGLREAIRERYRTWLPDHPARGLVAALTVGDQSELNDRDWTVFRMTGTSHLVAVSGFNVAIVAGVAFFALRWLWASIPVLCLWLPAQRAGGVGAAILAFFYAALAGLEAPVLRATVMVLLAALAALLSRRASLSRMLALAWLAVLVPAPASVLSPGVWLSFGAVAAIAYVASHRVGPIPSWREGFTVQGLLSLALAPLGLWFFGGISWVAPFINLLAVPVVAILTPLLVAALVLAWLWPWFGIPLLGICAEIVWTLREGLAWLAQYLPQPWLPAAAPAAALLLAGMGALLLFTPRGLPTRGLGLVLLAALFLPHRIPVGTGVRIAVLDVGQGLAVAVRTAHHAMVFDTGPAYDEGFDAGRSIVAPYLLGEGVPRIDLLMVSHADLDHRGGAPAVRELLAPRAEQGALVSDSPCRSGNHWEWDGVRFEVLHPDDGHWSRNNGGCVLRIAAGDHAVLLPADIEAPAEKYLLQTHASQLRADLLVAPHHGSRTSSTPDFASAVRPRHVIYAAGFANTYHLPRLEVERRYRALGAREYMTGTQGAVIMDLDAERGIHDVVEWRQAAPRLWRAPSLPVSENR